MKCPLLCIGQELPLGAIAPRKGDCLKEECAWYQKELDNCIIYQMGMELGTICLFLEELKEKMPHEGQFRR